jgi:hypothetical protein
MASLDPRERSDGDAGVVSYCFLGSALFVSKPA